jgi:hypothetical protein
MKLCPLCGHQNKDEDKYCAYCGTKLEDVAPQAKPQPVVETQPTIETQPAKADSNPWVAADTFAIIGFAAAIAGVGALGIPSLIFSILGLKSKRLHGMAVAGLVLSIIGMVFFTIYVIILLSIGAANIFPYLSSF